MRKPTPEELQPVIAAQIALQRAKTEAQKALRVQTDALDEAMFALCEACGAPTTARLNLDLGDWELPQRQQQG